MGLFSKVAQIRQEIRETPIPLPNGKWTTDTKAARAAYKADAQARKAAKK